MSMETLLKQEIEDEFNELSKMQVGSEEYRAAVDGLTKLIDRGIEYDKFHADTKEKTVAREEANRLRSKELHDTNRNQKIDHWLTGMGMGLSGGLAIWGTLFTFAQEREITVTTLMGRQWVNALNKIGKLFRK